jgi:phospholipid/cholesterol/gamma-HCH transport system substrate-binding protein
MRASTMALWLCVACDRSASDRRVVQAALAQAPGVSEGSPVTYRGVSVGTVQRIRLTDSAVLVTIALSRADVPLRATDRVATHASGIFGVQGIEIVPSPAPGRAWRPGDVLQSMPPDTLAGLRAEVADALVRAGMARLGAHDTLKKPDSTGGRRPHP